MFYYFRKLKTPQQETHPTTFHTKRNQPPPSSETTTPKKILPPLPKETADASPLKL